MCRQTMTTITTDQRVRPLEPSTNHARDQETALSDPCLISRLSKWLWSCRASPPSAEAGANSTPEHLKPTDVNHEMRSSVPEEGLGFDNAFACRACQAWGVECDRQKPRCSHCLDQQILCFYVEPLRVTMKRAKASKKTSPVRSDFSTS